MESFLSLFVFHDTYVVSFLVVGITIVVVVLLVFNQKSPESVVKSEIGGSENIEGALRRVLGEQRWAQKEGAVEGATGESGQRVGELESEVLEKDRAIAELNKQLTQAGSSGDGPAASGDNGDLMQKIGELEARLEEYEIIEDDIADLSLYKTENDKLKEELVKLKSMVGDEGGVAEATEVAEEETQPKEDVVAPVAESTVAAEEKEEKSKVEEEKTVDSGEVVSTDSEVPEQVVEVDDSESTEAQTTVAKEEPASGAEEDAIDLVAEFEKVVNSQVEAESGKTSSESTVEDEEANGTVVMSKGPDKKESMPLGDEVKVHPKLKNVSPNSKEEAEVFITELKSLKKGSWFNFR